MSEIEPETVDRMVALIRRVAAELDHYHGYAANAMQMEGRAIVALLPEPVDPDLIEARKIVASLCYRVDTDGYVRVMKGRNDSGLNVRETLAGIKRGRELATSA